MIDVYLLLDVHGATAEGVIWAIINEYFVKQNHFLCCKCAWGINIVM